MDTSMTYIYEIYKERSISQAAKNLYITQPALSISLKKVENEIGLPLFDRNTIPLRLTEAGELYIEAVRKIRDIEKELQKQLNDLSELERGHITVSGANFFSSYILPPIIHRFRTMYPGIDVKLIESESNELYDMMLANEIDLILDAGTYDETIFDSELLCSENLLFAVPYDDPKNDRFRDIAFTSDDILENRHLLPDAVSVPLDEFNDEKLVLLKKGHDMHDRGLALCEQAGFEPKDVMYLNQLSTAAQISAEGLGCTFLTDALVKNLPLKKSSLLFYKIDGPAASRSMYLAFQKKTHRSKAMSQFIDLAKAVYDSRNE